MAAKLTQAELDAKDDESCQRGKSIWHYTDVEDPEVWEKRKAHPPLTARLRYCMARLRQEQKEGNEGFQKVWEDQAKLIQGMIDDHGTQHGSHCV
jgi:hypothetical protein